MEAIYFLETSADFQRIHGVIFHKIVLFSNSQEFASWIQSTQKCIYLISILLSSRLYVDLPSDFFPSNFLSTNSYQFHMSLADRILIDLSTVIASCEEYKWRLHHIISPTSLAIFLKNSQFSIFLRMTGQNRTFDSSGCGTLCLFSTLADLLFVSTVAIFTRTGGWVEFYSFANTIICQNTVACLGDWRLGSDC
jgi:hypothetical protein